MLWAIYGVLHSLLRAAVVETGRVSRVDGWHMGFWQALCGLGLCAAFLPVASWPDDFRFYLGAIGTGLILTVGMMVQLRLSEEKHGRVSAIYMPLEAAAAMVIWVLVTPYMLEEYANDSLMSVSVALAFAFSTFALFRIRMNDASWKTFAVVAPVGLTYAVAGVVTKIVLTDYAPAVVPQALSYTAAVFATMTVTMGISVLARRKTGPGFTSRRTVHYGFVGGLFSMMGYGTFAVSVAFAPNPGYTSMLAMLLPVWLLSWHGFLKMDDKASPLAALFIVISMLLLIVASH